MAVGLPLWVVIITVCVAARMLSSSVENLSARRYNSSMVASGSRDRLEERGGRSEASSKVLQDRIHTVNINMLDSLSEPACEVPNGFIFPFEDSLEGADIPFPPD